jgi:hypothetical protein
LLSEPTRNLAAVADPLAAVSAQVLENMYLSHKDTFSVDLYYLVSAVTCCQSGMWRLQYRQVMLSTMQNSDETRRVRSIQRTACVAYARRKRCVGQVAVSASSFDL